MVGMTPWGVFFLACKLLYTKCWLLCQQAQVVPKRGFDQRNGSVFHGQCLPGKTRADHQAEYPSVIELQNTDLAALLQLPMIFFDFHSLLQEGGQSNLADFEPRAVVPRRS